MHDVTAQDPKFLVFLKVTQLRFFIDMKVDSSCLISVIKIDSLHQGLHYI